MHINGITQKAYIEGNQAKLELCAIMNGFNSVVWYTYMQAQSIGAQVKKGSKGCRLKYFKEEKNKDTGITEKLIKTFVVFNKDQIDFNPIEIQQG